MNKSSTQPHSDDGAGCRFWGEDEAHLPVFGAPGGYLNGGGRLDVTSRREANPLESECASSEFLNCTTGSSNASTTHEALLEEACESVRKRAEMVGLQWYPAYHMAPPAGWMSVPGGLCFHNGLYHAFYQHNPFSENWGPMHWGHFSSIDMVHWEQQPIALAPGAVFDRDGCFSGSAVSHDGQMYVFYTGHSWCSPTSPLDDGGIHQVQCLAVSTDGVHFEKLGLLLEPPPGYTHFRDPKVWYQEERWWMVCGAKEDAKGVGKLILFHSDHLHRWDSSQYLVVCGAEDMNTFMWECPDLFQMDDKFVLVYSPQGVKARGHKYRNLFQSGYIIGHFSGRGELCTESKFKELDHGHDFYAPQTFVAPDGRRILIGWLDMWESPIPTKEHGWSGCLTLPRELILDMANGRIRQVPPRELLQLRVIHSLVSIPAQDLPENAELTLVTDCTSHEVEVCFLIDQSTAEKYGLWLGSGLELFVDAQADQLVLYRHYPQHLLSGYRSIPIPDVAVLKLRVYIDRSSIEVFVNDGEATFSSRIYPAPEDRALRIFSLNGDAKVIGASIWQLEDAVRSQCYNFD